MIDEQSTPTIPGGMVTVSKAEFFQLLAADRRDIMPRNNHREYTSWVVQHTGERWGWTTPGWAIPGAVESYAVISTAKKGQQ